MPLRAHAAARVKGGPVRLAHRPTPLSIDKIQFKKELRGYVECSKTHLVSDAAKKQSTRDPYLLHLLLQVKAGCKLISPQLQPNAASAAQRSGHGKQEPHATKQILCHFALCAAQSGSFGPSALKACRSSRHFCARRRRAGKGSIHLASRRRAKSGY
jgi:hypothetical protein